MRVSQKLEVFKGFPELATDPDRLLNAIREWRSTTTAEKHGVVDLRFYVTEKYEPILEFTIDIKVKDPDSDEIDIFFPLDDLLIFIGTKTLDASGLQALTNKILFKRQKVGPKVYQSFVFRLPGKGWNMDTAFRGLVTFGRTAAQMADSFNFFFKEGSGKTLVQIPFNKGQADSAGINLNDMPIVISLKVIDGRQPLIFFCDKLVEATDTKLVAETSMPLFNHAQCGNWMLVAASDTPDGKPLKVTAKNEWIATGKNMALFIMSSPVVDRRLSIGSVCEWSTIHNEGGEIRGRGIIVHTAHNFIHSYSMIRMEWRTDQRGGSSG